MKFQADFGNPSKKMHLAESGKFRLAVVRDFSGRKNKGELENGEMPFHYYMDSDGDQIALSCPEQLFTETQINRIASQNLIPVDSIKGKPEVHTGNWGSLEAKNLKDSWFS